MPSNDSADDHDARRALHTEKTSRANRMRSPVDCSTNLFHLGRHCRRSRRPHTSCLTLPLQIPSLAARCWAPRPTPSHLTPPHRPSSPRAPHRLQPIPLELLVDAELGFSPQGLRVDADLDSPLAELGAPRLVAFVPVGDGVCAVSCGSRYLENGLVAWLGSEMEKWRKNSGDSKLVEATASCNRFDQIRRKKRVIDNSAAAAAAAGCPTPHSHLSRVTSTVLDLPGARSLTFAKAWRV